MKAFRITLSLAIAAVSVAGVVAEQDLSAGARSRAILRAWGFLNGDRAAETAYESRWEGRLHGSDGAIEAFKDILLSDAASPYRWCDLGEALIEAGFEDKARYCIARAVELAPLAPSIQLRAANAYQSIGDTSEALKCASRVLQVTREYDDIVFATYGRFDISTEQVLAEGLPETNKTPARGFVRYLLNKGLLDDVGKAWETVSARRLADDQLAAQYSNALLSRQQFKPALEVWLSHFHARANGYGSTDYIFNGGFEHDTTGVGFDWRINPLPNASMTRDSAVAHSGRASLRIKFTTRKNVAFSAVRQTTYLKPGSYVFEGRVRTASITTDEGIGFCVWDSLDPNRLYVRTPTVVGTSDWVRLSKVIVVRPPTSLVEVAVLREPSLKFDSEISGTAWIDDVRLTPVH